MKRLFEIFKEINRAGIDNSVWGCVQDVETKGYFGTELDIELRGKWIYVLHYKHELPLCREYVGITLAISDCDDVVDLYVFDAVSNYDSAY